MTSDSDRSHDAWLPSPETQQVLVSIVTGSVAPLPEHQTQPSLSLEDPLVGSPFQSLIMLCVAKFSVLEPRNNHVFFRATPLVTSWYNFMRTRQQKKNVIR